MLKPLSGSRMATIRKITQTPKWVLKAEKYGPFLAKNARPTAGKVASCVISDAQMSKASVNVSVALK